MRKLNVPVAKKPARAAAQKLRSTTDSNTAADAAVPRGADALAAVPSTPNATASDPTALSAPPQLAPVRMEIAKLVSHPQQAEYNPPVSAVEDAQSGRGSEDRPT